MTVVYSPLRAGFNAGVQEIPNGLVMVTAPVHVRPSYVTTVNGGLPLMPAGLGINAHEVVSDDNQQTFCWIDSIATGEPEPVGLL